MAKRPSPESDDDQDEPLQPTSKRARVNGNGSHAEDVKMAAAEQEEDIRPESDFEDDAEAEEFARTQSARMGGADKWEGEAAQSGVIKSIEVRDFMCHKHLTINLGRQINFIVGHNGSGKSAFLTALTIALGGKASATGRGNGLRELVRSAEGVSKAIIVLKLWNEGPDAYKPEEYGTLIVITRTINRENSGGGYKLSSSSGAVVSTRRDELQAICDHFGIQVENPINILTQDAARQFLATTSASEKYQLFLKGTQLAQLQEDYEKLKVSMEDVARAVANQEQALKQLRKDAKHAKALWTEAEAAQTAGQDIEQLTRFLAWSYVVEIEDQLDKATTTVATETANVEKAKKEKRVAFESLQIIRQRVEQLQAQAEVEQPEQDDLANDLAQLLKTIATKSAEVKRIHSDVRATNENMVRIDASVKSHEKKIRDIEQQNSGAAGDARRALRERLDQMQAQHATRSSEALILNREVADLKSDINERRPQQEVHRKAVDDARNAASQADEDLRRAQSASSDDALLRYGPRMSELCRRIRNERWSGPAPVGPIGLHVKVKTPEWAPLLESMFGKALNGFIVTNKDDRFKLMNLMRSVGANETITVLSPETAYSVNGREPDAQYATVLRVITINNDLVRNSLINTARIEGAVLARTRTEAEAIVLSKPANLTSCYSADLSQVSEYRGGRRMQGMQKWSGMPRLSEDKAAYINECRQNAEQANSALKVVDAESRAFDQGFTGLQTQLRQKEARRQAAAADLHKLNDDIGSLEDRITQENPAEMGISESLLKEARAAYEAETEKATAIVASGDRLRRDNAELVKRREDLQRQIKERATEREQRLTEAGSELPKQIQAERVYQTKTANLQRAELQLAGKIQAMENVSADADAANKEAAEVGAEPERALITSTPKEYQKLIKAKQKALREAEQRNGMSLDEIKVRYNDISRKFRSDRATVEDLNSLRLAIKTTYQERMDRLSNFLGQISVRAKIQFHFNMSKRGYDGKLKFNHDSEKLAIQVQVDESMGSFQKDVRGLSGGEKSFSTVAFLLTLWEAVGCPIRGLDEFDVFQDSVNRGISMRLLIDCAKATDHRQHIFITPQNISNLSIGPQVRIHRLSDPERENHILA